MNNPQNPLAHYYNDDNTFEVQEATDVVEKFVCGICYGPLAVGWVPNMDRVLVACPVHGNVCRIGRVTHATVSIQTEASFRNYHRVIRNLPDLWGDLINQGFERVQAGKITQYYVCEICGGRLIMQSRADYPHMDVVDIVCSARHGNINDTGYVRRDQFVYNFQRIKDWEKNLREQRQKETV